MTPKQVTIIDIKELKELELRCECGAAMRLPLPLKNNKVPQEQACPACERAMWAYDSPVKHKIERLLGSISDWNGAGYSTLNLGFVLTTQVDH